MHALNLYLKLPITCCAHKTSPPSRSIILFDVLDEDYDKSMKAVQAVVADEDRRLADLDRDDVANYRGSLVDARRQSLVFRGQLEVRHSSRSSS